MSMRLQTLLVCLSAVAAVVGEAGCRPDGESAATIESTAAGTDVANVVTLTEQQMTLIGMRLEAVGMRRLQSVRGTPGRLQYDNRRHVEIRASLAATISQIHVKPGDRVVTGQVLAILTSPEVGAARADVLLRESELALSQQQLDWEQASVTGLELLVSEVEQRTPADAILSKLKSSQVGAEGERILSAYASTLLRQTQADQLLSLQSSGAVSGQSVATAVSERDSSRAELEAAIQESLFTTRHDRDRAAAAVADAQRRLQVSREQVSSLVGYGEQDLSAAPGGLSFVEVRAPFDGTIEAQPFSVSERVAPRESLFTLADTSHLWVAADIREAEWPALTIAEGQVLMVTAPALPDRRWDATVYYVGREVDPQTNSVPLVATIDNTESLLRPGQFVRIEVPLEAPREVLAAPAVAVVEHDGQSFVFSPMANGAFQRIDIQVGPTIRGWTEITSGLAPGATIVTNGAFALKSELLLAGEKE